MRFWRWASCSCTPMRSCRARAWRIGSRSRTEIAPRSGVRSPSTHSIVVVLPAPLGPIRPKICPASTSKEMPSTATVDPYVFRIAETRTTGLLSTNGELEAAFERQGHRAQTVARIVDELEVLVVRVAELHRVVADDDGALPQPRRGQRERRKSHRRPDVDEHEVDRTFDVHERVPQIAITQIDERRQ